MSHRDGKVKSDLQLRRWFLTFNDKYFSGSLPFATPLRWEPCEGKLAYCEEIVAGEGKFMIRLDPSLRWSKAMSKATLLHEMVHLKLAPYMGHGRRFQEEMMRLAQVGAFAKIW